MLKLNFPFKSIEILAQKEESLYGQKTNVISYNISSAKTQYLMISPEEIIRHQKYRNYKYKISPLISFSGSIPIFIIFLFIVDSIFNLNFIKSFFLVYLPVLFSLYFIILKNGAKQYVLNHEMIELAKKERGLNKDWKCVPLDRWDSFLKDLIESNSSYRNYQTIDSRNQEISKYSKKLKQAYKKFKELNKKLFKNTDKLRKEELSLILKEIDECLSLYNRIEKKLHELYKPMW